MSGYDSVLRGGLRLKGGVKKKKKKKELKRESEDFTAEDLGADEVQNDKLLEKDTRTEAEKRFDRIQEEREKARIAKAAKTSYRDQVEGFNKKLAAEPEHFDTPKVSHTK